MDWKTVSFILFVIVLGQPALGQPGLTAQGDQVRGEIGDDVALTCRVDNLGSNKLNWVFAKHFLTIFHGDQQLVGNGKYSLLHPTGGITYSLQIRNIQIADQGFYKCEIDGMKQAATIELVVTDSPVPPEVEYAPDRPFNRTGCCRQRGVSESCVPICQASSALSNVDINACGSYLPSFIYCGSDGRNHENCCARSGVQAGCLLFCSNDAGKIPSVSSDENYCLAYVDRIISCYQYGGALLPSPPESVSVLPFSKNGVHVLLVSWKKPMYNPSAVTGYIVHFKKASDAKFMATQVLDLNAYQYEISVAVNNLYSVYVVAVGHHGSSQPSEQIDITAQDTSSPGHAVDVGFCCGRRQVPDQCLELCTPRVWSTFNTNLMIECDGVLPDIFSCLAGERNHGACCTSNNVPELCVGMCSGNPPTFNKTLAACLPRLSVIEACVQSGLSTQPSPPEGLKLRRVDSDLAVLEWAHPNATDSSAVDVYHIQLRRGNEKAIWSNIAEVRGTFVEVRNLTETENYALRVISQVGSFSSLPSAVIRFRTPADVIISERPTVAHNLTQCCIDSGMPLECALGCLYGTTMTAYYRPRLPLCMNHIGTVLTCAADGRDHTPCCIDRNVSEVCHGMCVMNTPGPLDKSLERCIMDTAKIVMCFSEGIGNLVRMPENLRVTNVTRNTISIRWDIPETGPKPDHYLVKYVRGSFTATMSTAKPVIVLQSLNADTEYKISVISYLDDLNSPPTQTVTVFTPKFEWERPFVAGLPDNTSRALWNNRTHCCQTNGIPDVCQPLCLNQPSTDAADCSAENHKILTCAADGRDHSSCCRAAGLPKECMPLCSSHTSSNFSVRLAGCLADSTLSIITSCFLANSSLMPAIPKNFEVNSGFGGVPTVSLEWTDSENCDTSTDCVYDIHYWRNSVATVGTYSTVMNVSSPHLMKNLVVGGKYTFTITARNSKGSGAAAPWQTILFGILRPDISIAQQPEMGIFDQGVNISLICDLFNVQAAVNYTWRLRNRVLGSGKILRLTDVTKSSEGNYSCVAAIGDFTATALSYVSVRYQPEFRSSDTETVSAGVGAQAVLEFGFQGHPITNALGSVWTKDGEPISQSNRHSLSAQLHPYTGITVFKLTIDDVVSSDYGSYQCRVANKYGFAVVHTSLMAPSQVPTPIPPSPEQKRNISNCCKARGVITTCMPLCTLEVSVTEAINNPERFGVCLIFFQDFVECAADGADHTLCCEHEVVPQFCLPFCKGKVPLSADINSDPNFLQCVPETPTILQCMETGYDKIPTAPLNVRAEYGGNNITVMWSHPRRNAELVTSYTILYNYTDSDRIYKEVVTKFVGLRHELRNIKTGHDYYIWMTAESQNAGRSQMSSVVSISTKDESSKADASEGKKLTGGEIVGIVVAVIVVIALLVAVIYFLRRSRNNGKQKLVESVGFDNTGYENQEVHIGKLP